jgi:nicotinate-nucleotide adenylyltransferase
MPGRERWGVFGGTFDPPHIGHLVAAQAVRYELDLDRVLFVVANLPWQKSGEGSITPSRHRFGMVDAILSGVEGLEANDIEILRGGDSYMADTLAQLEAPDRDLFLILGSDAAQGLPTWNRPDEVRARAEIAVVGRPGSAHLPPPHGWTWRVVECPLLDLSSTELRARFAKGAPVEFLVPDVVIEYVNHHDLYRSAN